jgi:hypothetical protein
MPTTYLNIANPTVGDRQKGTISVWIKRSKLGSTQYFVNERSDNNNMAWIAFSGGDALNWGDQVSGVSQFEYTTNRKFRDTSAWYHFVFAWDTTLATASERVRTYVNGVEETSFATTNNPSQNYSSNFSRGTTSYPAIIGRLDSGTYYFGGSMAHFHRVDGQQLTPSTFGQTDSTTGIWKPKTNPSITYTGSSSFNYFLKFENTSDYGEDSSGENNAFSVGGGTMTQTIDTPSNVFATLNPLQYTGATVPNHTFSNGNLSVSTTTTIGADANVFGTLGVSQGKWYYEYKFTGGNTGMAAGWRGEDGDRMAYYSGNGYKYDESGSSAYGASYTTNDIIGVAADLDNGNLTFYKNGTTQGEITNAFTLADGQYYQPFLWDGSGSNYITCDVNFGNGYFGTTAVASAGTNAGIGTFEYDVPSGYKALCTKNINAQEYS